MKQQKGDNIKHFSYFGGKILPNSYQFLENCQNSDDFRKIRPRYAQCNYLRGKVFILNYAKDNEKYTFVGVKTS